MWAAGYEWYAELGLYRCWARFYDPACAHWLQPDPAGQAGGFNLYGYCHNDPVNFVDPSGLAPEEPGSLKKQAEYGSGGGWIVDHNPSSNTGFDSSGRAVFIGYPNLFEDLSHGVQTLGAAGIDHLQNGSFGSSLGSGPGGQAGASPYNWREDYRGNRPLTDVDRVFRNFADGQKDDPMSYVAVTRGVAQATTVFVAPEAEVAQEGWMLTKGGQTLTNAAERMAAATGALNLTKADLLAATKSALDKGKGATPGLPLSPAQLAGLHNNLDASLVNAAKALRNPAIPNAASQFYRGVERVENILDVVDSRVGAARN